MQFLTDSNHLSEALWIDQADARAQLRQKCEAGIVSEPEADLIADFMRDGYVIVDLAGIDEAIGAIARDIDALWQAPPFDLACAGPGHSRPLPMEEGATIFGREPGVRLMDLHSHSAGALELYLNGPLHRLCSVLMGGQAMATQSLYFEHGSMQDVHRDPWYVNHAPRSHLLAAWFALEDIDPDAGPLNYVPGSHALPFYRFPNDDMVFHAPGVTPQEQRRAVDHMRDQLRAHGMAPRAATPRRGQVFLWHGSLIHGGSPIRNPALTRRSLVVHFGRRDTQQRRGAVVCCGGVPRTFTTDQYYGGAAHAIGWHSPFAGAEGGAPGDVDHR